MSENFFTSMLSDTGKISSKRWISITTGAVLLWIIVYSTLKAVNASERLSIIVATMCFIALMAGVATMPQLISLWKGGNPHGDTTKDDKINQPTTP